MDQRTVKPRPLVARFIVLIAVTTIAAFTGCGDDRPPTYSVSGTVTYNGQPVEGAQVALVSADAARPAIATTDAQGNFTLRTFEESDGAMAGQHRVTIVKNVGRQVEADNPYPTFKNALPTKYARPDTSGLVANISEDGENTFQFDLVDG